MIDERRQEQAVLHVLGALSPQDAYEFQQALAADRELKDFVSRLNSATSALAGTVPTAEPPPQLRAKILAQVSPPQKSVLPPERSRHPFSWLPWALATCFGALCILLNLQDSRLRQTISKQAHELSQLNALAQSLQSATNNLQQVVLGLQETNRLANLKIALLNSLLADAPKTVAVSLWDESRQDGVFVVENLKSLPTDRDYQLWVLDNGTTPVDAGVFHVDEHGGARMEFRTRQPIKVAGKFAVTEEIKGGVSSPTIKNMVLASN